MSRICSFRYTDALKPFRLPVMKTRSLYFLAAVGSLVLFATTAPLPTSGQNALPTQTTLPQALPPTARPAIAPNPTPLDISPQLAALIKAVTAQSKQMTANQAQVDAKLDQLTETIRQARLYGARLGGKGGTK